MPSQLHEFEQCCWDLRGQLSRLGPDEICCEGLTPRQCRVLRAVGTEPELNLSLLARREGLTASGMSRRVDPLVDQGYLERKWGAADDGRALRLELTKKGKESLDQVEEQIYGGIASLWRAMPAHERSTVLDALKVLVRAARRIESQQKPPVRSIPLRAR